MRSPALLAVTFLFAGILLAQTNNNAIHDHSQGDDASQIDGAVHPELISDSTAYRLYFLSVAETPNPTAKAKTRQLAHLRRTRLDDDDLQILTSTLENFKLQYASLIEKYNREAEIIDAKGGTPDIHAFLIQRDALVQSTRDYLKRTLSFAGSAHLEEHVQAEKRNMKVGKEAQ
jgi:hypothetical protein